jgi:hypothetical protein
MSTTVSIDPRVLLAELRAKAEFLENRCLMLGQENLQLRQSLEVQSQEIEKLKAGSPNAKPAPTEKKKV